ncbi:MAG: ATP synthase F1 subunit epsilon [Bacteriovoracia bacterium]
MSEGTLKLSILSPERKLLTEVPVKEVTLTGSEGQIEILPGHAPMVGTFETGLFKSTGADGTGKEELGFISTGFFEVQDDKVTVLAEVLERSQEIDVERAKRAQKKAEDKLRDTSLEMQEFKKYQLKLQRSLIRQQVAGRTLH